MQGGCVAGGRCFHIYFCFYWIYVSSTDGLKTSLKCTNLEAEPYLGLDDIGLLSP